MTSELFTDAARLIKAGKKVAAREKLLSYVQDQPGNEKAWLWLAALLPELDDRITAMENAFTLNPRPETERRLEELRDLHKKQALNGWFSDPYQEAVKAFRNGELEEAQTLLERLLHDDAQHLQAWLGLSQITPEPLDKIAALQNVLAIDPEHQNAKERLQELLQTDGNPSQLARYFEEAGDDTQALEQYRRLAKEAINRDEEQLARKKVRHLKKRLRAAERRKIRFTTPTENWLRLAAGPVLLFSLWSFLHAGLNPLRWLLWMITAGTVVLAGSLLMIGAINVPEHPIWQRRLGETAVPQSKLMKQVAFLGVVLTYTPFVFLLVTSLTRLDQYRRLLLGIIGG